MSESNNIGLFHACYLITTPGLGGPTFNLNLVANTPDNTVHGFGQISAPVSPPVNITTKFHGEYFAFRLFNDTSILVLATGYPIIKWSPILGIGPVIPPNMELKMMLTGDWKSGTANYKYTDNSGNWREVKEAKVELIETPVLEKVNAE